MTKIGSFVFFGFPPAGSGVSPKSRMERYFLSRSGMGGSVGCWRLTVGGGCGAGVREVTVFRGSSANRQPIHDTLLFLHRWSRGFGGGAFRGYSAFETPPQRFHDIDDLRRFLASPESETMCVEPCTARSIENST
jgi:hypothetical protein